MEFHCTLPQFHLFLPLFSHSLFAILSLHVLSQPLPTCIYPWFFFLCSFSKCTLGFSLSMSWYFVSLGLWIDAYLYFRLQLIYSSMWVNTMLGFLSLCTSLRVIFLVPSFACKIHCVIVFNSWIMFHCANALHFIHSLVERHLDCFHFLLWPKLNLILWTSWASVLVLWRYMSSSGIAGSWSKLITNFLRCYLKVCVN